MLLPAEVTGQPIVAGMESRGATPGQGAFAATTSDGYCQQLIGRVIASLIGLGDEFELGGASNQRPSDPTPLLGYPNLYCRQHTATTGNSSASDASLVCISHGHPAEQRPHGGSASRLAEYRRHATVRVYATPLQLVEGGGGYRTRYTGLTPIA